MIEIWAPIKDYENYSISTKGNLKRGEKLLHTPVGRSGYKVCNLCKFGVAKTFSVARLMAQAFLEPVPGKLTVDHKNRIKTDNRIENLRYANINEQMENRNYPVGITGEKHITQQKKGFKVQIKRNGVFIVCQYFKDLDDAKAFRDICLEFIPSAFQASEDTEPAP
jgi:hypothetical protein